MRHAVIHGVPVDLAINYIQEKSELFNNILIFFAL